ncbi:GNAT family N-acetyltransferase [Streptomyces sp. NPDC051546]|uniref:GNAT family N-acetyltransferase n=1 Tax=Streptomyces sp. NPDC051546 TaxID=3365655 RepID=UPI0037B49BF0
MDIVDHHGLSVAHVSPEEVAGRPWYGAGRHIDVVRATAPAAGAYGELAAAGFIRKPAFLSWTAELGPDEDAFLSLLETKARQDIRRSRARADRVLTLEVHDPVGPDVLDRFLALYRQRVDAMAYGIPIASRQRERLLDGREKYFAVLALRDGELAGGCIAWECPEEDAVRIRFSAVTEEWRRDSLARTLYFAAMRTARDKGYRWATLGDEPNLYGHLTKAGLFRFKVRMGFRCVPSQDFHDPDGLDEADLVLNLDRLCDPCLILGYASDAPGERSLRARLVTGAPIDLRAYAAPFLAGVEHTPPAGTPARVTAS